MFCTLTNTQQTEVGSRIHETFQPNPCGRIDDDGDLHLERQASHRPKNNRGDSRPRQRTRHRHRPNTRNTRNLISIPLTDSQPQSTKGETDEHCHIATEVLVSCEITSPHEGEKSAVVFSFPESEPSRHHAITGTPCQDDSLTRTVGRSGLSHLPPTQEAPTDRGPPTPQSSAATMERRTRHQPTKSQSSILEFIRKEREATSVRQSGKHSAPPSSRTENSRVTGKEMVVSQSAAGEEIADTRCDLHYDDEADATSENVWQGRLRQTAQTTRDPTTHGGDSEST